jgi:hypothetical protein
MQENLERNILTTNQERLAFRLQRILRELRRLKDNVVVMNYSQLPEGFERDDQNQTEARAEGQSNMLAAYPPRNTRHQNGNMPSMIHERSMLCNTSAT